MKLNLTSKDKETSIKIDIQLGFSIQSVTFEEPLAFGKAATTTLLSKETTLKRLLPKQGYLNIFVRLGVKSSSAVFEENSGDEFKIQATCDVFAENTFLKELFPSLLSNTLYRSSSEDNVVIDVSIPVAMSNEIISYLQDNHFTVQLVVIRLKDQKVVSVLYEINLPLVELLVSEKGIHHVEEEERKATMSFAEVMLSYTKEKISFGQQMPDRRRRTKKEEGSEEEVELIIEEIFGHAQGQTKGGRRRNTYVWRGRYAGEETFSNDFECGDISSPEVFFSERLTDIILGFKAAENRSILLLLELIEKKTKCVEGRVEINLEEFAREMKKSRISASPASKVFTLGGCMRVRARLVTVEYASKE